MLRQFKAKNDILKFSFGILHFNKTAFALKFNIYHRFDFYQKLLNSIPNINLNRKKKKETKNNFFFLHKVNGNINLTRNDQTVCKDAIFLTVTSGIFMKQLRLFISTNNWSYAKWQKIAFPNEMVAISSYFLVIINDMLKQTFDKVGRSCFSMLSKST